MTKIIYAIYAKTDFYYFRHYGSMFNVFGYKVSRKQLVPTWTIMMSIWLQKIRFTTDPCESFSTMFVKYDLSELRISSDSQRSVIIVSEGLLAVSGNTMLAIRMIANVSKPNYDNSNCFTMLGGLDMFYKCYLSGFYCVHCLLMMGLVGKSAEVVIF